MYTGRNWRIRAISIAALIASPAMAVTGVSSGTAIPLSSRTASTAAYAAYLSTAPFSASNTHQRYRDCKWCLWSGGGAAPARPGSVAMTSPAFFDFATLTTAPSSSNPIDAADEVSEILATNIAFGGDKNVTPVRFVGAVISRLETGMNWRSNSFSIAGSRIWSKIIKFSSTGVNVRLPLN
jgi:hypothetical protein